MYHLQVLSWTWSKLRGTGPNNPLMREAWASAFDYMPVRPTQLFGSDPHFQRSTSQLYPDRLRSQPSASKAPRVACCAIRRGDALMTGGTGTRRRHKSIHGPAGLVQQARSRLGRVRKTAGRPLAQCRDKPPTYV